MYHSINKMYFAKPGWKFCTYNMVINKNTKWMLLSYKTVYKKITLFLHCATMLGLWLKAGVVSLLLERWGWPHLEGYECFSQTWKFNLSYQIAPS
jgi:hypothetical protein